MKSYLLQFGTGDPRTFTGLSATFLIFKQMTDGTNVTAPSITEIGSGTGLYGFQWGTTVPISFLADAATTSPGSAGRYIAGQLDPADRADEYGTTLVAIGTSLVAGQGNFGSTLVAIGNTAIALGTTNVALGTTTVAWGSAIGATQIAEGATIVAIGNTLTAIGVSSYAIGSSLLALIGTTAAVIGDNSTDPSTLFGYLKRLGELEQGREQFAKGTGVLTMYDRTGATTLATRTIVNSATLVTKT